MNRSHPLHGAGHSNGAPTHGRGLLALLRALLSPNGDGTMTITSTGAGSARLVPVGDGTMTITSGG